MSSYRSSGSGRPRVKNDEERILPLINVVFLLLIFFMLAGQFAALDPFRIEPPSSLTQEQPERQAMEVLMDVNGQLALDGAVIEAIALKSAVSTRKFREGVVNVRLKADGRADATRVVVVMELLRDAGVEKLHLLTSAGKP